MKKKLLIIFFILSIGQLSAQTIDMGKDLPKHSEYWYASLKFSIINNISLPLETNPTIVINSPNGDMLVNQAPFTYTPGGSAGFFYNFDFKNNKMGLVIGVEAQNFGFSDKYSTLDNQYRVINNFRATCLNIPIYFKIWSSDIYKTQTYMTAGLGYQLYYSVYNYQISNWDALTNIRKLNEKEMISKTYFGQIGFNSTIFFFNLRYNLSNFLNSDYIYLTDEGSLKPYSAINFTNSIYAEIGLNLPLTRWLTTTYWTAEKIRRILKPKR